MDIHRCRFVPYPPAAINALAFSHPSSTSTVGKGPPTLRLAIGRANGDIEIWNPLKGAWFQETTLRGGKDRSIEGLVWTQDPDDTRKDFVIPGRLRLFSIGYSTAVTEWDLELGRPLRHSSGNYGEVWCLAAQPALKISQDEAKISKSTKDQDNSSQSQQLAIGCADGAIVLLSTADKGLDFQRILTRPSAKKARVLSITFQNRNIVIAGCADSTIRVLDSRGGQLLRNLSLGAGPTGGPRDVLVWTVKCLPNGDVVSGDSTGEVKFWDRKNYSLFQRIQGHRADVLDIATSANGETIVTGGADRRSTMYRKLYDGRSNGRGRWSEMMHRRYHSHDVKALATFETKNLSIVASGGLDTTPIITPLRQFGKEEHRTLSSLPQIPPLHSSPSQRLIMSWWNRELNIWRIQKSPIRCSTKSGPPSDIDDHSRKLVASIFIQGEENISSASLSADGHLLAVATISGIKVFRLRRARTEDDDIIRVKKLKLPQRLLTFGAKLVQISPDSRWLLAITPECRIILARISISITTKMLEVRPKLIRLRRLDRGPSNAKLGLHGSLGRYERMISRAAFSSNSNILVVGDLSGHLDSWVLEGHEDLTQDESTEDEGTVDDSISSSSSSDDEESDEEDQPSVVLGQHWIRNPNSSLLPKLPSAPLFLSFRPSTTSKPSPKTNGNVAVHPTRHNPHPHSHDLPSGEDRLFALTCEHHVYEFRVLEGKLSAWSKRNPTSAFPSDFRGLCDRGVGCVWDVTEQQERIWLYGSAWLWMFDLSKDLPRPETRKEPESTDPQDPAESGTKKRKRRRRDNGDPRRYNSGAGGRIPNDKVAGVGRKMRKITGGEEAAGEWVSLEETEESSNDDDGDDFDDEGDTALSRLRRGLDDSKVQNNGITDESDQNWALKPNGIHEESKDSLAEIPATWRTYKYRPILGIVPLNRAEGEEEEQATSQVSQQPFGDLEVALVERPMWDVDLPPRYFGDQEWAK